MRDRRCWRAGVRRGSFLPRRASSPSPRLGSASTQRRSADRGYSVEADIFLHLLLLLRWCGWCSLVGSSSSPSRSASSSSPVRLLPAAPLLCSNDHPEVKSTPNPRSLLMATMLGFVILVAVHCSFIYSQYKLLFHGLGFHLLLI
jgi:hypothetical protein